MWGETLSGPTILQIHWTDRQHIFFGSVEEEDDVVPERNVGLRQDLQQLQHDGATDGVIARSWNKVYVYSGSDLQRKRLSFRISSCKEIIAFSFENTLFR